MSQKLQRVLTEEQKQKFMAVLNEYEQYRKLTEEEKERILQAIYSRPYLDLKVDWAFKHIFSNPEFLKMLLSDLLPEEISQVERLPNEIERLHPGDKNIVMDVLCKTPEGRTFIVEMQCKNKKSFKNRMFYYGASMAHAQLQSGQSYMKLQPVYVICFMDFTLPHKGDQLVYRYSLREQSTGELYGKHLTIYFCELPRLMADSIQNLSPVESWFYILKNMRTFEGRPEELGSRYAAIAEASKTSFLADDQWINYLRNMISEEEKLDIGEAYYEDGFTEGMKKGREEGIGLGVEQGRKETVQCFIRAGVSDELIAKATGLSLDEIAKLRAN